MILIINNNEYELPEDVQYELNIDINSNVSTQYLMLYCDVDFEDGVEFMESINNRTRHFINFAHEYVQCVELRIGLFGSNDSYSIKLVAPSSRVLRYSNGYNMQMQDLKSGMAYFLMFELN